MPGATSGRRLTRGAQIEHYVAHYVLCGWSAPFVLPPLAHAPPLRRGHRGHVAPRTDLDQTASRLFDGFDGKLGLDWEPVRPDPAHVSLIENPGRLTITTQCGGLCADETFRAAAIPAKNLYLLRNPAPEGGDFVITTCIESFAPSVP